MEKLILAQLENKEETYVVSENEIIEGIYDNSLRYFTKEDIEAFIKKFGFHPLEMDIEKIDEDELNDFLDEHENYAPQIAPGCYCEDVVSRKDLEEIVEDGGILFWDKLEFPTNEADFDWEKYYVYWDGSNHKCILIEYMCEIEAEYQGKELGNTFEKYYYKTKKGNDLVVFSSYYQGSIDILDEEECNINKIEEECDENN